MVLTDDDLQDLPLPSAHTIEVLRFVPIESVDPVYFDRSYFLDPDKSAVKPFVMMRDAMQKAGSVAVTKIAIRQRESLALLRVYRDVLMVETMLWPDEVRSPDFEFLAADPPQVSAKEMKMAASLIEAMSEPVFEPDDVRDDYREALESLVKQKIEGDETVRRPAAADADEDITSLIDALTSSIESTRGTRGATSSAKGRPAEKKAGAKKSAAKKTGAKKTGAKTAAAKKSGAKKSAAKKTGAKR